MSRRTGQGIVEYMLIMVIVVVALILLITRVGNTTGNVLIDTGNTVGTVTGR